MFKTFCALCLVSLIAIGCVQDTAPDSTAAEQSEITTQDWPNGFSTAPPAEAEASAGFCSDVVCDVGFFCCETPCGGFCVPKKSDGCFHICPP